MDFNTFDKYTTDPFERAELRLNPTMCEKLKYRMGGKSPTAYNMRNASANPGGIKIQAPLAMAYIPMQEWEEPYDATRALACATAFPSLNLPFTAYGGNCGE